MEPNTTGSPASPAGWTFPAAVLEHGVASVGDPSLLLSPAFSPAPSPGLLPASGTGSGSSSWYEQIPPSPAVVAGNDDGSLSLHAHGTSSLLSVPSSSFPTSDTLPTAGYDLFGTPEATAASAPLPALLGGEWDQEESSPLAASVLPECPSPGLFGFAGEFVAWPSEEMSSFFSPSSPGGLVQQGSDNLVGLAQPSSDSEMEPLAVEESLVDAPLPPIEEVGLAQPSSDSDMEPLAVEESLVDAPLPPIEEEEIDVSAFLVSDPEDQLCNASSMASPQMVGSGGGASASWMAPAGSTSNNWPPTAAAASACTMISTSSGSMACHSSGSSIGAGSSTGGMMKPSSPVPPLVPPSSSQGAGASSTNFNVFAQPPSSSALAPQSPNLQAPLLPVKQEVMEADFISLVDDDDEYGLCQDPVFGGWGSSSPASFAPGSWGGGGSSSSLSFGPGSWDSGNGSPSFAPPNSWGSSNSSSPSFDPSSWGGSSSSSSHSFAPSSWGGSGSNISNTSFAPGNWGSSSSSPSFAGSTPSFDQHMSTDNYGSSSSQNLSIGGKMPLTSGLPPLPRLARLPRNGGAVVFTDREKAIIAREKKLHELLRTDPKKVKRILYNRQYSAVSKARKVQHTKDLERMVVTLEERRQSLCAKLQSLEEGSAELMAQKMKMEILIWELQQQETLKDAVREGLRAEIQNLKQMKLN